MTTPYPTSAERIDLLSDDGRKLADLALAQLLMKGKSVRKMSNLILIDAMLKLNASGSSDVTRCYNETILSILSLQKQDRLPVPKCHTMVQSLQIQMNF